MSIDKVNEQKFIMALGSLGLSGLLIGTAWAIVGADAFIGFGDEYGPTAHEIADKAAMVSTVLLGVSSLAYIAALVSNVQPRPKKIKLRTT